MPDDAGRMRADWDRRAREDARYYVAFGRREQEEAEFQATAADVVRGFDRELRRLGRPVEIARLRALEIGCGPGRLMLPMSRRFAELHGVDVSEEMIRLASQRLREAPNAHPAVNSGADLGAYGGGSFDFVYSYAVFQHIPSREVVFNYLREARRVLKTGGLLRCQINGLPSSGGEYDTWHGVRISPEEVRAFARAEDMQLLVLEGALTQYMWVTLRKRPAGWHARLAETTPSTPATVRRITNAFSTEPLAPCRGRFASAALWLENLPAECDLLHLEASVGGRRATPFYIGPPENDGLSQLNVSLPPCVETGLQPVALNWLGRPLAAPVILRVVLPGPSVPRVVAASDAVDLLSPTLISSGIVKVVLEEVERVEEFSASIDGIPAARLETFCVDPVPMRYEVNIYLPPTLPPGSHRLEMRLGARRFSPILLETPS
ncbi:MAG: class I SAM-dependent methyltransferase [Bryobacterales bacterium]|nr:class I SAM-dependent methyltransferase [Bryobacterales bacterium]